MRPQAARAETFVASCFAGGPARASASRCRLAGHSASQEAEPLSHAGTVLRRSRKEFVLAGLATETKAPMVVGDEPKPSPTIRTAVLRLGHEACLRAGGWSRH